jgi:hypothetical protein
MSIIDRGEVLHDLMSKLRQIGRIQIGRILGSVEATNGAYLALLDLLERCYFMRAEINGLTAILIDKGVVTEAEVAKQFEAEFTHYFGELAKKWPELEFYPDRFVVKDIKAFAERSKRECWPR